MKTNSEWSEFSVNEVELSYNESAYKVPSKISSPSGMSNSVSSASEEKSDIILVTPDVKMKDMTQTILEDCDGES